MSSCRPVHVLFLDFDQVAWDAASGASPAVMTRHSALTPSLFRKLLTYSLPLKFVNYVSLSCDIHDQLSLYVQVHTYTI